MAQGVSRRSAIKTTVAAGLMGVGAGNALAAEQLPPNELPPPSRRGPRDIRTVQWLYSVRMPADTDVPLDGRHPMLSASERWPYVVPAGYWLGITDATIQSKMLGPRASYLVLEGLFSVPSNVGAFSFRTPLAVPPGTRISAHIINNSAAQGEWINISVQGLLVAYAGADYREAFAFLFSGPSQRG